MRIVSPKSGLFSNQEICLLKLTTEPTRKTAGGFKPWSLAEQDAFSSVVISVFCSAFVPQRISAAGVSGALPLAISFSVM